MTRHPIFSPHTPAVLGQWDKPGAEWQDILSRPSLHGFAVAFTPEPVLEALVAPRPIVGVRPIRDFFAVARGLYAEIRFSSEIRRAAHACLEWEGAFAGEPVSGATILSFDGHGKIERIRLYHYPFAQLAVFSAALHCGLAETEPVATPIRLPMILQPDTEPTRPV